MGMQVQTDEPEIIERVAALDIGKAEVVCCVRVPGPRGRRMQEVRTVSTMTAALLALGDWLAGLGVSRVVMEATADYWRAPFYLLEGRFQTWLVNAHDVKHPPGPPQTDRLGAVWLWPGAQRPKLRPAFLPPPAVVPGRRAADAAAVLRAAAGDPAGARPDPVPGGSGRGPHRGEAAGREAARRRPDQALGGGQRPVRGLRTGDHGRADRRRTRSGHPRRPGPRPAAGQDRPAERGADRPLHRPPRLPAGPDAQPDRRDQRRHRHRAGPDRRPARPFRPGGGPPG